MAGPTGRHENGLLREGDPEPVELVNPAGPSPVLLTCEHAGQAVPAALDGLGVPASEMARHIAFDIGAEGLARALAARLDAALVVQRYSRLVIDCNRPFTAPDSIATVSDGTAVPGNAGLDAAARRRRQQQIHRPLEEAIAAALDRKAAAGHPAVLVAVHSFTPRMRATGAVRDFEIGLLFNRDRRLAHALRQAFLAANPDVQVRLNEPYSVDDGSDYTIPVHGERRGIPHVLLEVRNDLIAEARGQEAWADRLAGPLRLAAANLAAASPATGNLAAGNLATARPAGATDAR